LKKVKDLMSRQVISVDEKANIYEISRIMDEKGIGSVIVIHDDKPVGIVTERDIITRCLAKERDPKKTASKEIMSSPLVSVDANSFVSDAAKLMISKMVRRIAVMEGGKLKGIITTSDMVRGVVSKGKTTEESLIYLAQDYEVF